MLAGCQQNEFSPAGTYENGEGEFYHFCLDNTFNCKITDIDHLLFGTYEVQADSTITLYFLKDDYPTDTVHLRFTRVADDAFRISTVGGLCSDRELYSRIE